MTSLAGELLTIRYVTLDQALAWLWDDNPKRHDLPQLVASIQRHGFRDPSIYDSTLGGIPAGNGRLEALAELRSQGAEAPRGIGLDGAGTWHVPLVFGADAESRHAAEAFGIAHNNLTVVGFTASEVARLWNAADYLTLLKRLAAHDELPVSVDGDDLQELLDLLEEPPEIEAAEDPGAQLDRAEELLEQWGTARGQLWEIPSATVPGRAHRLLCGDSTDPADVTRLMDGQRAAWMWTDPPYGVDYAGRTKDALKIENDLPHLTPGLLAAAFSCADEILQNGAPIYVAHPAGELSVVFGQAFVEVGWHFHETLVWVKNVLVMGHSDYHYRHEPLIYGWKGKNRTWYGGRDQDTVFEVDRPPRSEFHPSMKPIDLIAQHLLNSSALGTVGYEPFCGSGSTLVAAEQNGRLVNGVDIDPRYVAVTLERLAGMGLEPRLVEEK